MHLDSIFTMIQCERWAGPRICFRTKQFNYNVEWHDFGPKKKPSTNKANQGQFWHGKNSGPRRSRAPNRGKQIQFGLTRIRAQEKAKHQQSKSRTIWAGKNSGPRGNQTPTTQINDKLDWQGVGHKKKAKHRQSKSLTICADKNSGPRRS